MAFDPPSPRPLVDPEAAPYRSAFGVAPFTGRLLAQCVRPGDRVYVDGCVDPARNALIPCGTTPLVLTTGDGTSRPRVAAHADAVSGRLAAGAASVLIVLALIGLAVRSAPVVERLAEREASRPIARWRWWLAAGVAPLLLASRAGSLGPGSAWSCVLCAAAALMAEAVARRRRMHDLAWACLTNATPIALRDAATRQGLMELTVVGRATATGALGAYVHAWVDVRVDEFNAGEPSTARRRAQACWPTRLAVRDDSGDDTIDLADAALDLRASRVVLRHEEASEALRGIASSPVGALAPSVEHPMWVVEQCVLAPGERICVLTGIPASTSAPAPVTPYRGAAPTNRRAGAAFAPPFVHAGTLASLRRSVAVERWCLRVSWSVLVGVGCSLALATSLLAQVLATALSSDGSRATGSSSRSAHGSDSTHWRYGTAGSTRSHCRAAVSLIPDGPPCLLRVPGAPKPVDGGRRCG
ncbi:MAG: hypothetical protein Q8S73_20175 [Deltaproteobacteria bacterium]|nr:hypothetical protein [Myxococcales bacterium]MDP3216436.1 hypothetical protein [Deltaproteobacteria bacterium]